MLAWWWCIESLSCGVNVVDDSKHLGRCRRFQSARVFPLLLPRPRHLAARRLRRLRFPCRPLPTRAGSSRVPIIWVLVGRVGGGVSSQALPAFHPQVLVHLVDAGHQVVLQQKSWSNMEMILRKVLALAKKWWSLRRQRMLNSHSQPWWGSGVCERVRWCQNQNPSSQARLLSQSPQMTACSVCTKKTWMKISFSDTLVLVLRIKHTYLNSWAQLRMIRSVFFLNWSSCRSLLEVLCSCISSSCSCLSRCSKKS